MNEDQIRKLAEALQAHLPKDCVFVLLTYDTETEISEMLASAPAELASRLCRGAAAKLDAPPPVGH